MLDGCCSVRGVSWKCSGCEKRTSPETGVDKMKIKEQTIICPKCGEDIPLNTALMGSIEERVKSGLEKKYSAKEKEIQSQLKKMTDDFERREQLLIGKEKKIEALEKDIDNQVETRLQSSLKKERHLLEKQLRIKISEDNKVEMEDLHRQLAEKTKKIDEATEKTNWVLANDNFSHLSQPLT